MANPDSEGLFSKFDDNGMEIEPPNKSFEHPDSSERRTGRLGAGSSRLARIYLENHQLLMPVPPKDKSNPEEARRLKARTYYMAHSVGSRR